MRNRSTNSVGQRLIAIFVACYAGAAALCVLMLYWVVLGHWLAWRTLNSAPPLWWLAGVLVVDAVAVIAMRRAATAFAPGDAVVRLLIGILLGSICVVAIVTQLTGPELAFNVCRLAVVMGVHWPR